MSAASLGHMPVHMSILRAVSFHHSELKYDPAKVLHIDIMVHISFSNKMIVLNKLFIITCIYYDHSLLCHDLVRGRFIDCYISGGGGGGSWLETCTLE